MGRENREKSFVTNDDSDTGSFFEKRASTPYQGTGATNSLYYKQPALLRPSHHAGYRAGPKITVHNVQAPTSDPPGLILNPK